MSQKKLIGVWRCPHCKGFNHSLHIEKNLKEGHKENNPARAFCTDPLNVDCRPVRLGQREDRIGNRGRTYVRLTNLSGTHLVAVFSKNDRHKALALVERLNKSYDDPEEFGRIWDSQPYPFERVKKWDFGVGY